MNKKGKKPDAMKYEGNENENEEDEDMDMEEEGQKSLTAYDLDTSLEMLEKAAAEGGSRKIELLSKAAQADLSADENLELIQILESGGGELAGSLRKSASENQGVQDAIDVSDYLAANHEEMLKSQDRLANAIEAGNDSQREFNGLLAKAVSDVGRLVKGMSERLGVIEAHPARAPKSKGIQQPLQKSFGGAPAGEQLSKSVILDALDRMHTESLSKGMSGKALTGEDLAHATIKYETTNQISPSLFAEVQKHLAQ